MNIIKNGKDETQPERQRYVCKSCKHHFDDLSDSVFAGRHQPLRVWVGCLYLMGLNLSNTQIAYELDSSQNDVYKMTCELRQAMVEKKPEVELSGEVEFDEVYVTAGHKGQPETVQKIHAFPHCQTVTPVIELKVCEQIGGEAIAS